VAGRRAGPAAESEAVDSVVYAVAGGLLLSWAVLARRLVGVLALIVKIAGPLGALRGGALCPLTVPRLDEEPSFRRPPSPDEGPWLPVAGVAGDGGRGDDGPLCALKTMTPVRAHAAPRGTDEM
jgi:hypothetical protein